VRRAIVLLAFAGALMSLYLIVFVYVVAFVAAQPTPMWWSGLFPSYRSGALTWLMLFHGVGVLLLSLPFAFVIDRVFRSYGVWVALALTTVIAFVAEVPDGLRSAAYFAKWHWIVDMVELIGVLPVLVYILRRLTSNNRLERSRGASSVSQGGVDD
jgi:hypothetical protein